MSNGNLPILPVREGGVLISQCKEGAGGVLSIRKVRMAVVNSRDASSYKQQCKKAVASEMVPEDVWRSLGRQSGPAMVSRGSVP
jgi:hypothetical protein